MTQVVDINGSGDFVLSLNGEEVDRIAFRSDSVDALNFNISSAMQQNNMFVAG
jgi:hypothetical protein